MEKRAKQSFMAAAAWAGAALAARAWLLKRRELVLGGQVVLITGGSRGLGLVLAREFAQSGAKVAIAARDEGELRRALDDLEARGAEAFACACDVTDREQVQRLFSAVRGRFGRVDVLVNNAGVIQVGPMELMTEADYEEALGTHFWGPLYASLEAISEMRARHRGRIINIASIGGKISVPHLHPYCASKFALVGLSQGMRAELARFGIAVTTVCPGLMRTGSHRAAYFMGKNRLEYTLFTLLTSLPGVSMDAQSAARQIVAACRRGDADVVLSGAAKMGERIHALLPGITSEVLSLAARALPGAGGIGTDRRAGAASQTKLSPSWFTDRLEMAARQNNEMEVASS